MWAVVNILNAIIAFIVSMLVRELIIMLANKNSFAVATVYAVLLAAVAPVYFWYITQGPSAKDL